MPRPLKTLFIVADGARARWVERSQAADDFVTVRTLEARSEPAGHPQGVVFEGVAGRRATVQQRATAVRAHRSRFAGEIAGAINQAAASGALGRLALIAPAPMMRAVRERLTPAAAATLARTLTKDLSKTPDHELGRWLRPLERE